MIVGLIREGKTPPDRRAVLTPQQCAQFLAQFPEHSIFAEPSAVRCFPDQAYAEAGCHITTRMSECDVLLGVKEVPIKDLVPGATHFFFSHTYKEQPYNRALLKACIQKKVRLIDWELLKRDGKRLIGFGHYAGLVGAYETLRGFLQMKGLAPLPPAADLAWVDQLKTALNQHTKDGWRIVLTGTGRVAQGATEMLLAGGCTQVSPQDFIVGTMPSAPIFTVLTAIDYVQHKDGKPFNKSEFYTHPERFSSAFLPYAQVADIYIPCHFWAEGGPHFFTQEQAQDASFSLQFIGDISCDIAGPIPSTIRPSNMANPYYAWDPLTGQEVPFGQNGSLGVLAVDNLPGAVPGDATEGFGQQFLSDIFPAIVNEDAQGILARATETQEGALNKGFHYMDSYVNGMDFPHPTKEEWQGALDQALAETQKRLKVLEASTDVPTFENTVVAIETLTAPLDPLTERLFNYNSACTDANIQAIAQYFSPKLAALSNDILLNPVLFERVKAVHDASPTLDAEASMLLTKTYKAYTRNGALLAPEQQGVLRQLDERMGQAGLEFSEKILADTETWSMHLIDPSTVAGLPQSILQQAALAASEKGTEGWIITLDAPSYLGFMTYSTHRPSREKLWRAYAQRGARGDAHDTRLLTIEIARLRMERAKLLGYTTHAEFVLEERMAGSPKTVHAFLEDLVQKALPAAQRDVKALKDFAAEHLDIGDLQRWDIAFVSEKYKLSVLDIDDEITKPYFPLGRVQDWAFAVANRLYGLTFQPSRSPTYHADARVFDVRNAQGEWVAHLHADWYPRKGKRNGAWMTSYRQAHRDNHGRVYPIISMVGNFSPPFKEQPALLTFNEVLTLFHEFGHALHGMLGVGQFSSLTGTSVRWDFVELPSQFMENWCFQPKELAQWAKHFKTGEAMPTAMVERLQQSQTFLEGLATVRQLGLGLLDLAWHHRSTEVQDAAALEKEALARVEVWPTVEQSWISPAFSHIFAGGYSAGYYSYKWAEVLDADAFARFQEEAEHEAQVAQDFMKLLQSGGSIDPMELFTTFRGRAPKPDALLQRAGLHG
ncbi:MAG: hypothetical protein ABR98_02460 [Cryomorphaceae bacterium BACL7 MAG-120910-bin2]|jgi:Zn-dependent oligopeptidase/alanine dehydrogenase|nr:MAG: hypothetical protein ABR98_02460 [Cryomorphaceae bacterium BACL7 MAG-120910-bin2]KRO69632.1 MAG: hypothetical protein ABR88_06505 [Cryomorphaceae bacterium BACL7 MAG-120322-bin74]KRO82624.1 MAG: hypothetical protein ABR87_07090 [Cryomorphaceae bacterium BACL7 MAG-121220-bin83]